MYLLEDEFKEIDRLDSIEEIKSYDKKVQESEMVRRFWELRDLAVNSEDELEREKSRIKCRLLCRTLNCSIPCSSGISKFNTQGGVGGIHITERAKIGEDCTIAFNAVISANTFMDSENPGFPVIGDHVFIGQGAVIYGGISIGDHARIMPNCFVSSDVPENAIVYPDGRVEVSETVLDNTCISSIKFANKYPRFTVQEKDVISQYSKTSYLKNIQWGEEAYGTLMETCRLLGLDNVPQSNDFEGVYHLEKAYSSPKPMIERVVRDLKLNTSAEELVKKFVAFKKKYLTQECFKHSKTNCVIWFWDWILFARDRGFFYGHYFDFEFYKKGWKERDTFVGSGYRNSVLRICNPIRNDNLLFSDKGRFNKTFSAYIQRRWLNSTQCTFEEFESFVAHNDKAFIKPLTGSGGIGARVIDFKATDRGIKDIYHDLQQEGVVIEELISQHKDMASYNESTVNTVRIYSLLMPDQTVKVLMACARFGRKNEVADNFHSGGFGVNIDIETGTVISDAINMAHQYVQVHPDSGKVFKGFVIPEWQQVLKTVEGLARVMPNVRHIGWDLAITEDHKVDVVEGNCKPGYDMPQAIDQVGKRHLYDPYVKEIAAMKAVVFPKSEIWCR